MITMCDTAYYILKAEKRNSEKTEGKTMTERMNLNMEDLEMVTGGADRLKCGNDENSSNDQRKRRS